MNSNRLVFLDAVIGIFLLPIGLLIRLSYRLFSSILGFKSEGILIIKFLGAGNFLAIDQKVYDQSVDIITAKSNLQTLSKFKMGNKLYLLDDSSLIKLLFSSIVLLWRLSFTGYQLVINLEAESMFAKFITAFTPAKKLTGVSNVNKSYIDYLLYDRYLVNPVALSKGQTVAQLIEFCIEPNLHIVAAIDSHRKNFIRKIPLSQINSILLSPSCSSTDIHRRLSINYWEKIIRQMGEQGVHKIEVIFPSELDIQYSDFLQMAKIYPALRVVITRYEEFIKKIKECELLITVDSQALHVGQLFERPVIGIYGPTSPFGVNLMPSTYPVSQSLNCAPCTHKYLRLPCNGHAYCMNFLEDDFSILKFINKSQ
ncbi:glycosyltransferase family 9 protein [Polynucleobacter paneuropaeus]|nr:glycosyltransferase family 9 protein [Polynucleobacter paneuropaeus]